MTPHAKSRAARSKVASSEGRTVDIQSLRPSDDAGFERAARDFAWTVTWHPALKEGAPVEAWTQMLFPPQPQ